MFAFFTKREKLKMLSDALNFDIAFEMLSDLLKVGASNRYLWQDDIGQELNLLATILGQSMLSSTR